MRKTTFTSALFLASLFVPITSTLLGDDPASERAKLTYTKDVAPIFRERCETCHRPGEVSPMSLLTYEETRPWLRKIRKEVNSLSMPPWHADPKYGEFSNDQRLPERELSTILNWIDTGAEEGDPEDLPPAREWVEGWRIGQPDVVFTLPEAFLVPANGVVPYKYFTVPTNFKEDKWIVAAEARPDSAEVVHHILVFMQENGRSGRRRVGNLLDKEVAGFAPGEGPAIFRPGAAKLIKAGSTLLFQMHYTTNGKAQSDQSKVGFIFAKQPVEEQVYSKTLINTRFRIPPHAENHRVEASRHFSSDTTLHSMMPHMHLRGKNWEFRLVEPGGAERVLLRIPEYDFDWQHNYALKEPILIKAGSHIRAIAHFDNSKNNPFNPDPNIAVRWGDQTWDEMMIAFLACSQPVKSAKELQRAKSTKNL